jgi:plasmid stabilization system protein ParE
MTAKQVVIHPEALSEAAAAVSWYSERSLRAPLAFIAEIDKAIESISAAPDRWPILEAGCRRFPLYRFPYFIVYRQKSEQLIQVVAVAHARRKPGYWRNRT